MNKKNRQGFTLIELMIVMAIIGILGSVALPAYQTYVAKSILSALHASAAGGRTGMLSRYMGIGEMPEPGTGANGIISPTSITLGLDNALRASQYQTSVVYVKEKPTKAIFLVTLDKVNSNVNGKTLSFVYEDVAGTLSLTCIATNIDRKYVPKSCQ